MNSLHIFPELFEQYAKASRMKVCSPGNLICLTVGVENQAQVCLILFFHTYSHSFLHLCMVSPSSMPWSFPLTAFPLEWLE